MQNVERRRNRCSFCRMEGHNRLVCNDQRLLDFELNCATKCQIMSETDFYVWLTETYETNDSHLLKTYAAKKTRIQFNNVRDISIYKDAITRYIYEIYKYQYNIHDIVEDIRFAYLFLQMAENMYAKNEEPKKFEIESIVEPLTNSVENISECCICFESYKKEDFITLGCNHEFCNDCLKKTLLSDNREKPCCACCRTEVSTIISRTNKIHSKMSELIA